MKFDEKTITVLKNFATINPSLMFREGNVQSTMTVSRTILARATLDQTFDRDFGIYDLPRFLSVHSLFKDPELKFGEKKVQIASGKQKIEYTYAHESGFLSPPKNDPKFPSVDVQFTLEPEVFANLIKAAGALGVPEIAVVGDGQSLMLTAFDSKVTEVGADNPAGDLYSVAIGETEKVFNLIFKIDNLKILPQTYDVSICAKGLALFKGEYVKYWIAVENNSTFTG